MRCVRSDIGASFCRFVLSVAWNVLGDTIRNLRCRLHLATRIGRRAERRAATAVHSCFFRRRCRASYVLSLVASCRLRDFRRHTFVNSLLDAVSCFARGDAWRCQASTDQRRCFHPREARSSGNGSSARLERRAPVALLGCTIAGVGRQVVNCFWPPLWRVGRRWEGVGSLLPMARLP